MSRPRSSAADNNQEATPAGSDSCHSEPLSTQLTDLKRELAHTRSQLSLAQQSRRTEQLIRRLYEERTKTADLGELLTKSLQWVNTELGTKIGIVSAVVGETYTVKHCFAPGTELAPGQRFELAETYCALTYKRNDVVSIFNMGDSEHRGHPCYQAFKLETYIGAPLWLRGKKFGTLNFSSPEVRAPWGEADVALVGLLSRWVAQCLEIELLTRQRLRFERDGRLYKERYLDLLAHSPAIMYTCRADGDFGATYIAPNVEAQIGYSPEEFTSDSGFWIGNVHPEDRERILAGLPSLFESGAHSHDYRFRISDGTYRWMNDQLTLVRSQSGEPTGIAGVLIDIDERVQMEEQLRRSNAELQQFAYAASHDLQEPLRMIASYTGHLKDQHEGALDGRSERWLQYIQEGATRMQTLIEDLLRYSRLGVDESVSESVDLNQVVEEVLEVLRQRIDETDAVVTIGALPIVGGKPVLLRQMFQNLLENSLKFAGPKHPRITVAQQGSHDESVTICVSDEGIGIAAEHQERVLRVFQRLHGRDKYSGNGIGLAIVQRAVHVHGGTLKIDSQPGEGTSFLITLPTS